MYRKLINDRKIFISVLAVIFILTSIGLGILSVHIYDTVKFNDSRQELSDASGYFSDIIRRSDGCHIRTASIGGSIPALVIESYHNGRYYENWYYTHNDKLKTVKAEKGQAVTAGSGDDIMSLAHMDVVFLQEDLIEFRLISTHDTTETFNIHFYNYKGGDQ